MRHIATGEVSVLLGLDAEEIWDVELAFKHLKASGDAGIKRTTERRLNALRLLPDELSQEDLRGENDGIQRGNA